MMDSAVIGTATGIAAVLVSGFSTWFQHRQIQLMERGLDAAFDSDTSDSATTNKMERKFRALLNKRLSDVRGKMRQEFRDEINRQFQAGPLTQYSDSMLGISKLLADQAAITELARDSNKAKVEIESMRDQVFAETGKYASELETHNREIEAIAQRLETLRVRLNYLDMLRGQMQQIGQQLVQITSQE